MWYMLSDQVIFHVLPEILIITVYVGGKFKVGSISRDLTPDIDSWHRPDPNEGSHDLDLDL